MVCSGAEGQWRYWAKDAEGGAAMQEETRKTLEEVHGCSEEGWCAGEEVEAHDLM